MISRRLLLLEQNPTYNTGYIILLAWVSTSVVPQRTSIADPVTLDPVLRLAHRLFCDSFDCNESRRPPQVLRSKRSSMDNRYECDRTWISHHLPRNRTHGQCHRRKNLLGRPTQLQSSSSDVQNSGVRMGTRRRIQSRIAHPRVPCHQCSNFSTRPRWNNPTRLLHHVCPREWDLPARIHVNRILLHSDSQEIASLVEN